MIRLIGKPGVLWYDIDCSRKSLIQIFLLYTSSKTGSPEKGSRKKMDQKTKRFVLQVWGIPMLPIFTVWLNLIFMFELPVKIWVYFLIWLFFGELFFERFKVFSLHLFTYGLFQSPFHQLPSA